jgi:Zn-dependent protease with chaperone function
MFGVLPFLFAMIIIESARDVVPDAPLWGFGSSISMVMLGSLALWCVISSIACHIVARRGRHSLLRNWDLIAQVIILVWLRWLCVDWGWTQAAHLSSVGLLPFALALMIHWWNLTDAVRSVTGHHWTRRAMLVHHLRFSAMPILLGIALISDGVAFAARHVTDQIPVPAQAAAGLFGMNALMIVMFLFVPILLVRLWGAQPLPLGQLRQGLQQACESVGVRVAKLMRWPVRGGRMYNAAVVGVLPRFRYVLFTDDLLRDLDHRQLMAVLGHELGHARYGHLWLYLIFMNIVMVLVMLMSVVNPDMSSHGLIPQFDQLDRGDRQLIVSLLTMGALFRLVFGVISRACERQADLAGAEMAGDPAAMQEALKSVALLSGQPENAPNWRHYTIAQRIEFLKRVRSQPTLAAEHHRMIGSMRFSLIVLLVILLLSLAAEYFFNPLREAASAAAPDKILTALANSDPSLGEALAEADAGNITPLVKWLNRANDIERQRIALLHLRMVNLGDGNMQESSFLDDRMIYQLRNRLRAFINITTGNSEADLEIVNALAYGLVAGTPSPTKADLDIARSLVERVAHANRPPQHPYCDTIGCVAFALGDYENAQKEFALALELLAKDSKIDPEDKLKSEQLYQRRLAAAEHNLGSAKAKSADRQPLPLSPMSDPVVEAVP